MLISGARHFSGTYLKLRSTHCSELFVIMQTHLLYLLLLGGESISNEVPSQWRNLPSLALPDGSHNFTQEQQLFNIFCAFFLL